MPEISKNKAFLPYGCQTIEEDDIAAITKAMRADFLTAGPMVGQFETEFADVVGARYARSCSSGTAALHLAMLALDIGPNDTVIVPSMTFLASANAVRFVGAKVLFSDVDPDTGLIGPSQLEEALARADSASVKAVVVVHINGQCADMVGITKIARKHSLKIIEDACHALGAAHNTEHEHEHEHEHEQVPVGACALSDITCFSLHPVKMLTTAEGGMATTNNLEFAERLALLRNHGMNRDSETFQNREQAFDTEGAANPWYYEMNEIGYNYRLPDLLCALGCSQLNKLDRFVEQRRQLAAAYKQLLQPLSPIIKSVPDVNWSTHAYHLFVSLIDFDALELSRAQMMVRLREQGIGTQVHYLPVHRQPYYQREYGIEGLTGADTYYSKCLSLPLYPSMNMADVERVCTALLALTATK